MPDEWSDQDYAWRQDLGAYDVGSPVVYAGNVFLLVSRPDKNEISLQAFSLANGKRLWSTDYPHPQHRLHTRNTFASSTPAVDEESIFAAWSNPEHTYLKCFDHQGKEVWSRDFGTWQSQHGFGTSPRIVGSMVLLFNSQQADQLKPGQRAGKSRMIAVDRTTGKTVWEKPLKTTRSCYGVPAIYESPSGVTQVIAADTGHGLFGLDLKTGNSLWNLEVFKMRCCSTPLIVGDIAIGSSGSGGGGNHLVAVRIPKSSEQRPHEVYRIERAAPYVPTPVVKDGLLFMVDDKGIASCIDAATGDQIWQKRVGGNHGASPIVVGDKLLLISLDGRATILRAEKTFQQIGQFDLGGPVGATPAFADGRLLLRVGNDLVCLSGKSI
ncbi:MAG: PQQ-like beta-propeller repeat protein [Pirellulaceae bacterium]|nr:PQQ-like beta-propeller repeat protein [Pirellulaceae bacterium]